MQLSEGGGFPGGVRLHRGLGALPGPHNKLRPWLVSLCDLGSSPFCSLHLPLILVSSPHYALMTPHISTIRSSKDPSGEWLVGLNGEGLCFVIYDEP